MWEPSAGCSALFFLYCFWAARGKPCARESGGMLPQSKGVFMLIEVSLNGGRTRAEHPCVPCSPQEMAAAAKEAVAAGGGGAPLRQGLAQRIVMCVLLMGARVWMRMMWRVRRRRCPRKFLGSGLA